MHREWRLGRCCSLLRDCGLSWHCPVLSGTRLVMAEGEGRGHLVSSFNHLKACPVALSQGTVFGLSRGNSYTSGTEKEWKKNVEITLKLVGISREADESSTWWLYFSCKKGHVHWLLLGEIKQHQIILSGKMCSINNADSIMYWIAKEMLLLLLILDLFFWWEDSEMRDIVIPFGS